MPTLFELAGLKPPESIDGRNLLPAINGKEPFPEQTLTFYDGRITMSAGGEISEINLDPAESTECAPDKKQRSLPVYRELGNPSVLPRRNNALLGEFVIPKRSVFIVGLGRSGTQFFAKFFQRQDFSNVLCNGHRWPLLLRELWPLFSEGRISKEQTKKKLFDEMVQIMESPKEVFVCISHDCVYLIGILAEIFPNSMFVLLTRDPRKIIISDASLPQMVQLMLKHDLSNAGPVISRRLFEYWRAPYDISAVGEVGRKRQGRPCRYMRRNHETFWI